MNDRLELWTAPAALVVISLMVAASVIATTGTHPIAMAMVVLLGVGLALITIDTGSHSMVLFTAAYLLMVLNLAVRRLEIDAPLTWTVLGLLVLASTDAMRLAFARRRRADVEAGVTVSAVRGFVVVAVCSLATGGVVVAIGDSTANASWLLVPLALVLAVFGVVALSVVMGRNPGQHDSRRWQPGERLLAPPRDASDDPSFTSSMPPPPR